MWPLNTTEEAIVKISSVGDDRYFECVDVVAIASDVAAETSAMLLCDQARYKAMTTVLSDERDLWTAPEPFVKRAIV